MEYSFCVRAVFAFNVDLAQALGDFAVLHDAVDFADDGGIARLAGLEEFDDARQTARDVLGLGGFARNLREHVARLHFVAVRDHQVGAGGHQVLLAARARRVANENRGLVLFIARRQRDDQLREAGDFVHLLFDRDAGLQVLELDGAAVSVRIEKVYGSHSAHGLAESDRLAFLDIETRAVNDVVAFFFASLFVDHGDQAGTVHANNASCRGLRPPSSR